MHWILEGKKENYLGFRWEWFSMVNNIKYFGPQGIRWIKIFPHQMCQSFSQSK